MIAVSYNYESERLELTAEVPDDEDDEAYVILLRSKVWRLLSQTLPDDELPESKTHWSGF
jgi:hypothetical protein